MITFRWYHIYVGLLGAYWYISLPVGLLLGAGAMYVKSQHWAVRSLEGFLAICLIGPVIFRGVHEIQNMIDRRHDQKAREAHSWVLEKPTTVAGLELPADTKIYFSMVLFNMSQKNRATLDDIVDIKLAGPTTVFGITFEGSLHHTPYGEWRGSLYGERVINGWPCVGKIVFRVEQNDKNKEPNRKFMLQKCTLYKSHTIFGHMLPAGTHIELGSRNWTFNLPDKIIKINPENGKLTFSSDSTAEFNFGEN